jgi:hypothetical protein
MLCALYLWGGILAGAVAQSPEVLSRVQALHQEGQDAAIAGDYAGCVRAYQQAQELIPYPEIHFNIAKCYERDRQFPRAVSAYEKYLDAYRAQYNRAPDDANLVKRVISELIARLKTEVRINTQPPGADIFLGEPGKMIGQTPLTLQLAPGDYTFLVKREGFEVVRREIKLGERPVELVFKMKPIERMGRVRFDVNIRSARIFVDGKNIGMSPLKEFVSLSEGSHQLVVERARFGRVNRHFNVKAGKDSVMQVKLGLTSRPASWRAYMGYTTLVTGLAGIGFGYFWKMQADSEFQGSPSFNSKEMYQNISYIGGGALVATSVALLIWEYTRSPIDSDDLIVLEPPP